MAFLQRLPSSLRVASALLFYPPLLWNPRSGVAAQELLRHHDETVQLPLPAIVQDEKVPRVRRRLDGCERGSCGDAPSAGASGSKVPVTEVLFGVWDVAKILLSKKPIVAVPIQMVTSIVKIFQAAEQDHTLKNALAEMWNDVNFLVDTSVDGLIKNGALKDMGQIAGDSKDAADEWERGSFENAESDIRRAIGKCDDYLDHGFWNNDNIGEDRSLQIKMSLLWEYCALCMTAYTQAKAYLPSDSWSDTLQSEMDRTLEACSINVNDEYIRVAKYRASQLKPVTTSFKVLLNPKCSGDWGDNWSYSARDDGTNKAILDWRDKGICDTHGPLKVYGDDRMCPGMDEDADKCFQDYSDDLSMNMFREYNRMLFPFAKAFAKTNHITSDPDRNYRGKLVGAFMLRVLHVADDCDPRYMECAQCVTETSPRNAVLKPCQGSIEQMWMFESNGRIHSLYNRVNGCLDARNPHQSDSDIWNGLCHGGDSQKWTINDDGTITNGSKPGCMDMSSSSGNLYMNANCHKQDNQKFDLIPAPSKLFVQEPTACIKSGLVNVFFAGVVLGDCDGNDDEIHWFYMDGQIKTSSLRHGFSSNEYCMGVRSSKLRYGKCDGGTNQKWNTHKNGQITNNQYSGCLSRTGETSVGFAPCVDGSKDQKWTWDGFTLPLTTAQPSPPPTATNCKKKENKWTPDCAHLTCQNKQFKKKKFCKKYRICKKKENKWTPECAHLTCQNKRLKKKNFCKKYKNCKKEKHRNKQSCKVYQQNN